MTTPIIYTPTYSDVDALRASFEENLKMTIQLKRFVIDVRYHGFPQINNSDFSTDGTIELCKEYGADYYAMAPCYEQDKFNFACNILTDNEDNTMILLGSDEYLNFTESSLNNIAVMGQDVVYPLALKTRITEHNKEHKYVQLASHLPKVFINVSKIEAKYVHWAIYNKGTSRLLVMFDKPVPGMRLHHNNTTRPQERDDLMTKYQDSNIVREQKYHKLINRDRYYGG